MNRGYRNYGTHFQVFNTCLHLWPPTMLSELNSLKNAMESKMYSFNFTAWVFCLHQCLCITNFPSTLGDQKTASETLGMKLQRVCVLITKSNSFGKTSKALNCKPVFQQRGQSLILSYCLHSEFKLYLIPIVN